MKVCDNHQISKKIENIGFFGNCNFASNCILFFKFLRKGKKKSQKILFNITVLYIIQNYNHCLSLTDVLETLKIIQLDLLTSFQLRSALNYGAYFRSGPSFELITKRKV